MPIRIKKSLSNSLSKYGPWLLVLVLGVVVFLFWRFRYPFALAYHEQFQLFLFDGDYFCERMAEPGGLARYIAEFLVQFYNNVTIGALVLALLFMLLVVTMGKVVFVDRPERKERFQDTFLLCMIPLILLWYTMGDESVMLTYAVAFELALLAIILWRRLAPQNKVFRWVVMLVMIPLLYWLIGPLVLMVALFLTPWPLAVAALVYGVALILASAWVLPYPLQRLLLGVGYYRYPESLPYALMGLPLLVLLFHWLYRRGYLYWLKPGLLLAFVLILGGLLVPVGFDERKYELIEYDYLVRANDWQGIIAKAEQKRPDLPMSVSATNLALAMTNQLGDRAFDFYQRGSQGLLPKFERNFATTQLTGEIYFHLGLVNTAQRFAFEAMEAIPNYNKSARAVKRLAETNLINGQYDVARKYLQMLEKTIFYRRWAQRTMDMLGDEKAIDAHPLYATMRQYRLQEDFLFSDRELDKICGQLFLHNQQNRMAAQYLVMLPLLEADMSRFMQYMQVVQSKISYNPRHCQEGIAFAFMQRRQQPPQGVVSPMILQQMNEFTRAYSSVGKTAPGLQQFRNTVWYYLVCSE